ncbi:hypothetical protein ES703_97769 [subsurface metagenome]
MKGVREDILIRFGVFLCTSSGKMEPVVIFDNEKKAEGWAKSQLKASRPPPPIISPPLWLKLTSPG